MASLGSYTRSAAQATSSAFRSLPIRWRLAGGSAALTLVILAGFAGIVGVLTTRQVRGQFNDEVRSAADQLEHQLRLTYRHGTLDCVDTTIHLSDYASAEHAQIRIYDEDNDRLLCTQDTVLVKGTKLAAATPEFAPPRGTGTIQELGYRVDVRQHLVYPTGQVKVLYARPLSDVDHTLARVRFFLLLGVLGGTVLALLAGLATAQRAMRPIVELTEAAGEVARTRDPSRTLPHPESEDEVSELARTLEGMLGALDSARAETESMLARQREFVADASHELRTPLTSVLANLELLAEELEGEQSETAHAALRSTRRMRRLVGDLLLLARADARRDRPRRRTDLGEVLVEAAGELGSVAERHELTIDAQPVPVEGVGDDLHRLTLNLLENAVTHTPPGTPVCARTMRDGDSALLIVEDEGPGISPELEQRIFERFVRGGRDGGRGSGLGLAIVSAVVDSHGGSVTVEHPDAGGTRFVICLPAADSTPSEAESTPIEPAPADQTSTTTGRTIGRRRSRS